MRSIRLLGWLLLSLPLACAAGSDPYLLTLGSSTTDVKQAPAGYIPISINEDAAIWAAASKSGIWIPLPDGSRAHLDYRAKVMHSDGTWTFVGEVSGTAFPAQKVLITFGEHAVFGSVPRPFGPALALTTWDGSLWLVDPLLSAKSAARSRSSVLSKTPVAEHHLATSARKMVVPMTQGEATASNPATIDLLVVYTTDFRTSFGSTSAAITRIDYLVDTANQVLQDSQVYARIRVVHTAEVPYTGDPGKALGDLSGTNGSVPALSSVAPMRTLYGADAVAMMQMYQPTKSVCGSYWGIGDNLTPITSADASKAYSVNEEDSSLDCDLDGNGLVEVLGENFGLVPAVTDNAGTGAYPFSYAYIGTIPDTGGGQFCTLLAEDLSSRTGCTHVSYFSNPNITSSEWGVALGMPNQADAAQSLNLTLPIIATFEPTKVVNRNGTVTSDVDGDGMSDLLFQAPDAHQLNYWLMSGSTPLHSVSVGGVGAGYTVAATGDFNGDGKVDIVWTSSKNDLYMWIGDGVGFTSKYIGSYPAGWKVVGAGDVDGDGDADLLFNNAITHQFSYRIMKGTTQVRAALIGPVGAGYWVAATGDFNGDGKLDIVWTSGKGDLYMWTGNGIGFVSKYFGSYPPGWKVVSAGDVDGDGKSDLLFHNAVTNQFSYRIMNGTTQVRAALIGPVGAGYWVAATGDYNGDGKVDVVWTSNKNDLYMWTGSGTGFNSQFLGSYVAGWAPISN